MQPGLRPGHTAVYTVLSNPTDLKVIPTFWALNTSAHTCLLPQPDTVPPASESFISISAEMSEAWIESALPPAVLRPWAQGSSSRAAQPDPWVPTSEAREGVECAGVHTLSPKFLG